MRTRCRRTEEIIATLKARKESDQVQSCWKHNQMVLDSTRNAQSHPHKSLAGSRNTSENKLHVISVFEIWQACEGRYCTGAMEEKGRKNKNPTQWQWLIRVDRCERTGSA